MTNILYFYRVVRDAFSDSSSSQGEVTPQTSHRHTGETSSLYPISGVMEEDSSDGESDTSPVSRFKRFTFDELIIATGYSLSYDHLQGDQDDSEKVFKGWIHQKKLTATKPGQGVTVDVILLSKKEQLHDPMGLVEEVNYLGQLSHPNLVRLFGYCFHDEHQLLIYEGMPGTLKTYLHEGLVNSFPWNVRMKVALGVAKGLAYLHKAQVMYRNFSYSHVHLDRNCNAILSNFGIPKDNLIGDTSHVAPEYPTTGCLTAKSDVYSFGVLLLEILSGRQASESEESDLVGWALPYLPRDPLYVLDSCLEGQYSLTSAESVVNLAAECLITEPEFRPDMDEVVDRLEQLPESSIQFSHDVEITETDEEYSIQFSRDIETAESEEELRDTDNIAIREQEQEECLLFEGR